MEKTVKEVVQELYDLTQCTIQDKRGQEISIEEYKDHFFKQVDLLAAILGIELDG